MHQKQPPANVAIRSSPQLNKRAMAPESPVETPED
jgi:hypothetical protein